MQSVTVRIPGSTSNCGAGFDTLGLALQTYNTVVLTPSEGNTARPERESDARAADMVERVSADFKQATGVEIGGFRYRIGGDVPVSRGLGSSVTVLAGVLGGLNHWAGAPLSRWEMVKILTRIEGHPDNATAGVWGGFCVSRCGDSAAEFVDVVRVEIPPELKFVIVSPELEIATKGSRGVLPTEITHVDAVRSINSAAFLTAALVSGDYEKLRGAAFDRMHEPYRLPGIPGGAEALAAGQEAGALTGWLSGSGSSVLCVAEATVAESVASAMLSGCVAVGQKASKQILSADNAGMVVLAD